MTDEEVYKIKHLESEKEDWKAKAELLDKKVESAIKETKIMKKEIKNIQFKFIEILAIFVAIIGFLFGFVRFSTEWQFSFIETFFLIILFGIILYGFIFIIHKLFS